MKRIFLLSLSLLAVHFSRGQQKAPKEFEGYIEFVHHISSADKNLDIERAKKVFGSSSILYYKDGFYKWAFEGAAVEYEIFNPLKNTVFVYNTEEPPIESFATSDYKVAEDSFLVQQEMVAGLLCKKYYIETDLGNGGSWKRVFSYSSKLPLQPEHFSKCTSNAFDYIYPRIKALPVKIEVMAPGGLLVIYEAKKVVHKSVDPGIFKYP